MQSRRTFMIPSPSFFLSICLSFLLLFGLLHCQTVPCFNEILVNSQVQVNSAADESFTPIDYTNDSDLPSVTQFSISGWISSFSDFTLNFEAYDTTSSSALNLISLIVSPTQIELDTDYPDTTATTTNIQVPKNNQWSFVFISVEMGVEACLDVIETLSYDVSTDRTCISLSTSYTTLSFDTLIFDIPTATATPIVITRTILFHRNYASPDINALLMLMRTDSSIVSEYLFSQSSIAEFLIDNLSIAQNNVNVATLDSTESPILFDKGLVFSEGSYVTLAEFTMTPFTNEFTLTFFMETSVESSTSYQILRMSSTVTNTQLLLIELIPVDIFNDKVQITLNGLSSTILTSTCYINRVISWNQLLIAGYSYSTIDVSSPPLYFLEISINSVLCTKLESTQFSITSNTYQLTFGKASSSYDESFTIKAVRIYQGSYSPVYSTCNTRCPIMQRREHTPAENEKLAALAAGTVFTSATPAMNVLTLNSTMSLACLQCANQKYFMDEYCVEGASSCTKFLDIKSSTCVPFTECIDPLHSTSDCLNDCRYSFAIDSIGSCSIVCPYSCNICESATVCLSTGCPTTRIFNTVTSLCDCNTSTTDYYYDDGLNRQCLMRSMTLTTSPPTAVGTAIIAIIDILVTTSGSLSVPTLNTAALLGSLTIVYPSTSTSKPVPDLVKGIILYSTQYFSISSLTQFYSIRFWMNVQDQLGRPAVLLQMKSSASAIIFSLSLSSYDDYRSALKMCFFQRCTLIRPDDLSIIAGIWNQMTVSFDDSESLLTATVFLNANRTATARFEKFDLNTEQFNPYPSSASSLSYSLQFGASTNSFNATTSSISLRYISLFEDQVTLVNEYDYPSTDNCAIYSGSLCLLCLKGYRFASYDATVCEEESIAITDTTKFYYSALRMVHSCALNSKICTECETTPIVCKNCVTGRSSPSQCACDPGTYSDANYDCKPCASQCATCTALTTCVTCSSNRQDAPTCNCESGYYLDSGSNTCIPCDFSCISCDPVTASCICPNLATTFRTQSTNTCPCISGYFDPKSTTKICEQCFKNCASCEGADEDECLTCKVGSTQNSSDVSLFLNPTTATSGECVCTNPNIYYLSYNGICKPYLTAKFSLVIITNSRVPKLRIELSEPIERYSDAKWKELLDFSVIALDYSSNKRVLVSTDNLVLSLSNDESLSNVGYVTLNVKASVRVTHLIVKVVTYKAVRSLDGIPLQQAYQGEIYTFDVNPFIFNFSTSQLDSYKSQEDFVHTIQENMIVRFLRYISAFLFLFGFIQPIASLLFVQTILPVRVHLLICQFACFVFPNTPTWLEWSTVLPPSIYGKALQLEELNYASYIFRQMGISSDFLLNITETAVLLAVIAICYFAARAIDVKRALSWPMPDNKIQHDIISFTLNLVEVRLIYIFLSIFLQMRQPSFSGALNIISTILGFISFFGFIYLAYLTHGTLNSDQEKDEIKYARTSHLIQFIEHTKHTLLLNYKIIQLGKKFLYFMCLILLNDYPVAVMVISIIISVVTALFDTITRPFKIKWLSYFKILSSLCWVTVWICILAAHVKAQGLLSEIYYLDTSDLTSFEQIGNFLFYTIIVYAVFNIIVLGFKSIAVIHEFYQLLMEKKRKDIIYMCDKLKEDGEYQQVQLAFINLDKAEDSTNIFNMKQSVKDEKEYGKERFLFNFKENNLIKPQNKKIL